MIRITQKKKKKVMKKKKKKKKKKHFINNYEVNNHKYTNNNIGVFVKHRHPYACRLVSKYCHTIHHNYVSDFKNS